VEYGPTCYEYEFRVWPTEQGWENSVHEVFRNFPRVALVMRVQEFEEFRASLERSGFTLRETTRVPHYEPETVG